MNIIADYQVVAERAANAELTKNFNEASILWHEAGLLATSSANWEKCYRSGFGKEVKRSFVTAYPSCHRS